MKNLAQSDLYLRWAHMSEAKFYDLVALSLLSFVFQFTNICGINDVVFNLCNWMIL